MDQPEPKKRRLEGMSVEDRLRRSRERNREHARRTRQRKKAQLQTLQSRVAELQEEGRRPTYGLTTSVDTFNVWRLETHEYAAIVRDVRAAETWREKLGYVWGPPGWRPTIDPAPRTVMPQDAVPPPSTTSGP